MFSSLSVVSIVPQIFLLCNALKRPNTEHFSPLKFGEIGVISNIVETRKKGPSSLNRKGLFSWSGFGGVVKGNPPGTAFQFAPLGRTFAGAFGHDGINTGPDVAGCTVVCAGAFTDIQVGDLHPHKIRGHGAFLRLGV